MKFLHNQELDLAWKFANFTGRNIFLTGKAGTGKTTFLQRLKKESLKRLVVVAPTGVAAINAGGVTIHSFFQMPFGPIVPDENHQIQREFKRKFNRKKIDIIRSLDLLIIDEISMVRADLLDGIDKVLRKYKNRNKVFGGVQVLMIGDLQQLAPVVKDNEKYILQKYYETPFFFSSNSFKQANPVNIELKEIFRQQDGDFIQILNEVRENIISDESLTKLNQRYIPDFSPKKDDGYIILTTHNYKADKINSNNLDKLKTDSHFFNAFVEGDFPENAYPNDKRLELKVGAQVMFNKNDSSFEKRYYNGKIGTITSIYNDRVIVKCENDEEIEVKREVWEHVTYDIDSESKAIKERVKGSFSQIPLRLAWAITIHKSQGLTFEKAIIDAELSFAHGQTYVALSRCKTLEGIVLKSPVKTDSIITDNRVTGFNENVKQHQPDEDALLQSQKKYQLDLIDEIFDYYPFLFPINRLLDIYFKNKSVFLGNIVPPLTTIKDEAIVPLLKIKDSFNRQLLLMSKDITDIEKDKAINERIHKGIDYLLKTTEEKIQKPFDDFSFDTDNKALMKDFSKHVETIEELISQKILILNGLKDSFNVKKYLELRAEASLLKMEKKKKRKKRDLSKMLEHTDLFDALRELRSEFAFDEDVHHFQIFTQESLYQMCEVLPVTKKQLKKINGIGKVRLQKYGEAIIEIIKAYCIANNIEMKDDEPEIKLDKKNTKMISLELFQQGLSPEEIAKKRELVKSTIMGHLTHFIPTGEVKITDLIEEDRYLEIKKFIEEAGEFEGLSDLRAKCNEKYDYGELRLVVNSLKKDE